VETKPTKVKKGEAPWSVPTFRGVTHRYAFFCTLVAAPWMVATAPDSTATMAAMIYGLSLVALFATSAAYHGLFWRDEQRVWLRRLDHTMIYVLIAGGFSPFGMILLPTPKGETVFWALWGIAALMVPVNLFWSKRPKWLNAFLAIGSGWVVLLTLPDMYEAGGWIVPSLMLIGGLFHTGGAIAYGLKRPNLKPGVFEYHEFFHAVMLVGIVVHHICIVAYVLPAGSA
jgi:hemolysin III